MSETLSFPVDLEEVWDQIDDKTFVAELRERCTEATVAEAIADLAPEPDDDFGFDDDPEPLFQRMGDWDRDELLKALREDDGRRCIDVLKRHAEGLPR